MSIEEAAEWLVKVLKEERNTRNCRSARGGLPKTRKLTWLCLKMSCTPKANGFADHYPIIKMAISLGIYTIFRQTHLLLSGNESNLFEGR